MAKRSPFPLKGYYSLKSTCDTQSNDEFYFLGPIRVRLVFPSLSTPSGLCVAQPLAQRFGAPSLPLDSASLTTADENAPRKFSRGGKIFQFSLLGSRFAHKHSFECGNRTQIQELHPVLGARSPFSHLTERGTRPGRSWLPPADPHAFHLNKGWNLELQPQRDNVDHVDVIHTLGFDARLQTSLHRTSSSSEEEAVCFVPFQGLVSEFHLGQTRKNSMNICGKSPEFWGSCLGDLLPNRNTLRVIANTKV